MRRLSLLFLALASCQTTTPVGRRFDAPTDRVVSAARAVVEELGEHKVEDGVLTTYWTTDEAAREGWSGTGQVVHSQIRYRVTIEGASVAVEARTRLFVRRGALRRDWEDVDPAPAAARLLERIEARLRG
jgi:hypothetical protein